MNGTKLFSIGLGDVFKAAVTAGLAAVAVTLLGYFSQENFSLITADWVSMGDRAIVVFIGAFLGYVTKNFFSIDKKESEVVFGIEIDKKS